MTSVPKLLFGPCNTNAIGDATSSASLQTTIDLGDIFDDLYFPDDLDFSAFFEDLESGVVGVSSWTDEKTRNIKFIQSDAITVPPPLSMPQIPVSSKSKGASKKRLESESDNDSSDNETDDGEGDGDGGGGTSGKKRKHQKNKNQNQNQNQEKKIKGTAAPVEDDNSGDGNVLERRERNREHAKKSRIRKRVLLDSLSDQLRLVREENIKLRRVIAEKMPKVAHSIFEQCTALESNLLATLLEETNNSVDQRGSCGEKEFFRLDCERAGSELIYNEEGGLKQHAKILMEPDYRLMHSLVISQQNFVVSDPSLPDNPIVYASEGFCRLSGYKRDDIIGRNCRFLQGPGTDQAAVDVIRRGVAEGRDISVCLLNYKADGSPFWNQFFVGALRDNDGKIVNYVGVQCEVNMIPVTEMKDRVKRLPVPDFL